MAVVVVIYILRLFRCRLSKPSINGFADSNAFLNKTIFPPWGLIYDRNDSVARITNRLTTSLLSIAKFTDWIQRHFCSDLNITTDAFIEKMKEIKDRDKNPGYSSFTPQVFMTQLDIRDIAKYTAIHV